VGDGQLILRRQPRPITLSRGASYQVFVNYDAGMMNPAAHAGSHVFHTRAESETLS
jgi:hypothetical protein